MFEFKLPDAYPRSTAERRSSARRRGRTATSSRGCSWKARQSRMAAAFVCVCGALVRGRDLTKNADFDILNFC